jgi:hypothetical protein
MAHGRHQTSVATRRDEAARPRRQGTFANRHLQDESVDADPERRYELKRSVLVHREVKVSEQHLRDLLCAHAELIALTGMLSSLTSKAAVTGAMA